MFEERIEPACKQVGNECFPAGALESGTSKRIARHEEHGIYDQQGFALSHIVANVAEMGQPRIVEVIDVEIVERPDEAG
jgi:hypothetical protein